MNLLICGSHGILEYDDLRLFADLGFDVFSPGGYEDPSNPGESLRPALPDAPHHPELAALCREQREKHAEPPGDRIDWAKADLHPALIEWADVIMVNCFPIEWIAMQWERIRHKRVIWRTIGQSNPWTEATMGQLDGLEIVRYSPAERRHFEPTGHFAGEDAVIRFAKYPADFGSWTGEDAVVGNITQNMVGRGNACGLDFWLAATEGLPTRPAGPSSDRLPGGVGALSYDEMREYLRRCRAYLYTGTQPASYTLGLIEALMTGVPTISIGPQYFPAGLFEGHEIAPWQAHDPEAAHGWLEATCATPLDEVRDNGVTPHQESQSIRRQAIALFGAETIGAQWRDYLGASAMRAAA